MVRRKPQSVYLRDVFGKDYWNWKRIDIDEVKFYNN